MLKSIKGEFKRISFPTRKEIIKNTAIVISTSVVTSTLLALLNSGISALINLICKRLNLG